MTAALRTSAYPKTVDELMPDALALVERLGDLPTRNRLMTELKIGAPKAAQLLDRLADMEADGHLGVLVPSGSNEPDRRPDVLPSVTPDGDAVQLDIDGQPHPFPPIDPTPTAYLRLVPDAPADGQTERVGEPDSDEANMLVRADVDPPRHAPSESLTSGSLDVQTSTIDSPSAPAVGVGSDALTSGQAEPDRRPDVSPDTDVKTSRRMSVWPVYLLALPAFVAVWSGWVGLGQLTGFGVVHPLPGIWDSFSLNTAITLPIGVETYAAFALRAWLVGPARVRRFAKWSAIGSLVLGAGGQVAYHLMSAAGVVHAPWPITTAVACLPVIVLGMGAALAHLLHVDKDS